MTKGCLAESSSLIEDGVSKHVFGIYHILAPLLASSTLGNKLDGLTSVPWMSSTHTFKQFWQNILGFRHFI